MNGSGVSEAEVSTQGNRNIIVEIPGENASSLVDAVKRTAQLRFRIVAGHAAARHPGRRSRASSGRPARASEPVGQGHASGKAERHADAPAGRPGDPEAADRLRSPTRHAQRRRRRALAAEPDRRRPRAAAEPRRSPTAKGASVDDPLAWSQNPGAEWLRKFAAFTCPTKGDDAAPVADDADQPLITCDDKGQKFLLSKAVIEGTELKSASYGIPQNGIDCAVNLGFKGDGPQGLRRLSTAAERQQRHLRDRARRPGHLLRRRQRADPRRQRPDHR